MIRHDDEANQSSGTCYTLYLEFLGGLVPLLKGKRTSKIRPEFVIFDPQIDDHTLKLNTDGTTTNKLSHMLHNGVNVRSESSDSDLEDGCSKCLEFWFRFKEGVLIVLFFVESPRLRSRKARNNKKRNGNDRVTNQPVSDIVDANDELAYLDTLPEVPTVF